MSRLQALSRWLQHLCTAGQTIVVLIICLVAFAEPYKVARILIFTRYDRSWLARLTGMNGHPLLLLALTLWGTLWLLGFWACRGIFRAHARGEAFRTASLRSFRLLAAVWMGAFPVGCILAYAPKHSILAIVPTMIVHLGPKLLYLLVGLALLVLARIMDDARQLQDEQDLVV
ncbi:DUF2975 domain-containing protein [Geothrix sp. PMB-07]|uniref:DUF2975 domain-containing protein n=1 Tax=Geothrix sp. PMB-07 TaxID=3068640 RepID=UPI002740D87C|nr:DUF2975 domain-containing protein [Geothrix sp. PMB-07]WLT32111.1 DUF2975 domain-containing protein [Geothrix sp. PMB-07]